MFVITDHRICAEAVSALEKYGFEPILLPPAEYLSDGVASHTDILIFMGFGRLFSHKRYYEGNFALIDRIATISGLELTLSDEPTGEKYPHDVLFNACLVGNRLICNEKTVSKLVLEAARCQGCEIINVPQGYTKCSVTVVSDNAIITADKSIASACKNVGIDVLTVSEGHISLPPYDFGFIGGASGVCRDKVFFCGSLDSHPDSERIKTFCAKHNKAAISLTNSELLDVGSLFFIGDKLIMDKSYWNEKYWVRHMEKDDLDNIEDPWIEKYEDIFMPNKGRILDLGCGVGQYSAYFASKGFTVTASDISKRALTYLKQKNPQIETVQLDMTEPLPFVDDRFDVVFANLSIHFFSADDTKNLISEIKRILKRGGLFIGSCNSSKAYKYIEKISTIIEEGYYMGNDGRSIRLFDEKQFHHFFSEFHEIVLKDIETKRFNRSKNMWEFIYKNI